MNLNNICEKLAADLGLDAEVLKEHAAEDTIGGWEESKGSKSNWPIGSIHPVEGQIVYALIRAMRPDVVVEFGVAGGCSSKHILHALVKNRKGKLYSADPAPAPLIKRFTEAEKKRWVLLKDKGQDAKLPAQADIVIEDTYHTIESTAELCEVAKTLNPRLILVHDAEHYLVGKAVNQGIHQAGLYSVKSFLPDGSACGYAYWVGSHEPI
jgi:hypothetical protein